MGKYYTDFQKMIILVISRSRSKLCHVESKGQVNRSNQRETLVNTLVHLMCMKLGQNVCEHEISNDFFVWGMYDQLLSHQDNAKNKLGHSYN